MGDDNMMLVAGALGMLGLFGVIARHERRDTDGLQPMWARIVRGAYVTVRFLVGAAVFVFSWIWAIQHWGWLLGIAFGWIPAAIVGVMAAFVWWIACYVLFFVLMFGR